MVFVDSDGETRGIYVDVLDVVAEREGWELQYVPGPFPRCLERLDAGEIDLMTGIAYSEERAERWAYTSGTLLSNWGQLYLPQGSPIESLIDLDGATVAVLQGDIYYKRLAETVAEFGLRCRFEEVDSFLDVLQRVADGDVDAGLVSRLVGAQHEGEFAVVRSSVVCCPSELRYAAPMRGDPAVLEAIDRYLVEARGDHGSAYYESLDRWLDVGVTREVVPAWARTALLVAAAAALLLLGSTLVFRWRLRIRTEELSRMAAQYHQAQKMEAVGRLAAGIAHDFNNQLAVVEGYGRLLLDEVRGSSVAEERVQEILQASNRASVLVSELLAFGRKQSLRAEVLDVNLLIHDLAGPLSRVIGEDVHIERDLAAEPLLVLADAVQLQQVVMNLTTNARDAMPRGGRLTLHTSAAEVGRGEVTTEVPGEHVLLSVRDTGAGIPDHARERIFEPFFTTKPEGEGSGLGLAMVHGFVAQSRGFVRVRSEPGQGSTFELFLPRVGREEGPPPRPSPAEPAESSPRAAAGQGVVLVVEDDDAVRHFIVEVLRRQGFQVRDTGSSAQALEMAAAAGEQLELLVTDVRMPELSGPELADTLVEQVPGLRVLFVSGYSESEIAPALRATGRVAMLPKPFRPAGLLEAVDALLRAHD